MAFDLDSEAHQLISSADIEKRKTYVGLESVDVTRIRALAPIVEKSADRHVNAFFDHLAKTNKESPLFRRREILDQGKQLKRAHLIAMVKGDYGLPYVEKRVKMAVFFARAQVDHPTYLGAFHHLLRSIGVAIVKASTVAPAQKFDQFMSFQKIGFFDLGIIVETLAAERERTIALQQDSIRELSTPVLQIRDRLLILPIIGVIDSYRAKQLTDGLLHAIRDNRAKVVVLDITGVATVDSKVANHLIQTAAAARLMGATAIITGLSADVAQSLVALGVDLGTLNTIGDLQGGLEEAERLLGYKVVMTKDAVARVANL